MASFYLVKKPQMFGQIAQWLLLFFFIWFFGGIYKKITFNCECFIPFIGIRWTKWSAKSSHWCPTTPTPTGVVTRNSRLLVN
jgi:hypothetical protein